MPPSSITGASIDPTVDAEPLRNAIRRTWPFLTRDLAHLTQAAEDPKLPRQTAPVVVYVPRSEDFDEITRRIAERSGGAVPEGVELQSLPVEHEALDRHGLLYLPGPYVVPGGRFNEYYGWDSWFIQRGLLRSGAEGLAEATLEQARYEIRHYGMVLNANRSYYLTRSQPPVFSQMVREAHRADPSPARLKRMLPAMWRYHAVWASPPRLDPASGLSRYRDDGYGPAPEALAGEVDAEGRNHYERVIERLRESRDAGADVSELLDPLDRLTPLAYRGDRSMREGGFDASNRFGILSLDIVRHAPVCLNTLLYLFERDLAFVHRTLGDHQIAEHWRQQADERAERIRAFLWDEEEGLFLDFHMVRGARNPYPFLTTFYPLFAGIASLGQAERVRDRLETFERAGGLVVSPFRTGCQWDAPFAWAPMHLFAVGGLHRYGFETEARRIAKKFLVCVSSDFLQTGVFREKYDAETVSGEIGGAVTYGYASNEVGFGWTNAVVLELLDYLESGRLDLPLD